MLFFGFFAQFFDKKKRSSSKSKTAAHHHLGPEVKPKRSLFLNEKSSESTFLTDHSHGSSSNDIKGSVPHMTAATREPTAVYTGGYSDNPNRGICLRIANGGAGQTGLVERWANAFIQDMVSKGAEPFKVAWYLGDTTESLAMLSAGTVDIALTYNEAAEEEVVKSGKAVDRKYGFRDHFALVGPKSNPAELSDSDDVLSMFSKIVACGNADVVTIPSGRPATRFLSRFDKSATNIKESQIFITIGQVPWAYDYSKWYHQYPRFPHEALVAAAALSEYTLTDYGTWLSAPSSVTESLRIFKMGSDDKCDILLNPAHVLLGKAASIMHADVCHDFMTWVVADDGGQKVVATFEKDGHVLYSKAPKSDEKCGMGSVSR